MANLYLAASFESPEGDRLTEIRLYYDFGGLERIDHVCKNVLLKKKNKTKKKPAIFGL